MKVLIGRPFAAFQRYGPGARGLKLVKNVHCYLRTVQKIENEADFSNKNN